MDPRVRSRVAKRGTLAVLQHAFRMDRGVTAAKTGVAGEHNCDLVVSSAGDRGVEGDEPVGKGWATALEWRKGLQPIG